MTGASPDHRVEDPPHVVSFEAFFQNSSRDVYRGLYASLGESDLAEEATAEAFVRAYARWTEVSRLDNATGWAYRVGLNWATSVQRRRRFVSRSQPPEQGVNDPNPVDPALISTLRKLSRKHLEVVVLRYFFDLDQKSISEVLGIPLGTVRSRLSRALSTLGNEIDEYEGANE